MNDFIELEYKYNANDIKLEDFITLMNSISYNSKQHVSSWDHYYTSDNQDDGSLRFRNSSDHPELTKKIKINDGNNWNRIEVDVPLDPSRVTEEGIDKFCEIEGYTKKTSIYKSCFVYWQTNVNYVYYVVYDKNMKEKGRFIEVEVNKSSVKSLNQLENGALNTLNLAAHILESLGLTPQHRLKKSLFELFVK